MYESPDIRRHSLQVNRWIEIHMIRERDGLYAPIPPGGSFRVRTKVKDILTAPAAALQRSAASLSLKSPSFSRGQAASRRQPTSASLGSAGSGRPGFFRTWLGSRKESSMGAPGLHEEERLDNDAPVLASISTSAVRRPRAPVEQDISVEDITDNEQYDGINSTSVNTAYARIAGDDKPGSSAAHLPDVEPRL